MKRILAVATLCAMPILALGQASAKPKQLTGYISDSKCAATHNMKAPDAKCVAKCISSGASPVFVDSKNQVWTIDNPDTVSSAYGKQVTVAADQNTDNKSLHIVRLVSSKAVKGSSGMMD